MQDREDEAQVDGDRRLASRAVTGCPPRSPGSVVVDLVVERDHLVGQLDVALLERVQAAAERAEDERALLLERRLELVELLPGA